MFKKCTKFDLQNAMNSWTKNTYSLGVFSTELYPRSSIAIQKTVWMLEFSVLSMTYRCVNKFKTHETATNLNRRDTNRQPHLG